MRTLIIAEQWLKINLLAESYFNGDPHCGRWLPTL
ncbi:hypothetical protein M2406_002841 [Serratia sp. BIGb0163]|nr:hypothetical protein [Serratia sp. BIGb0163]